MVLYSARKASGRAPMGLAGRVYPGEITSAERGVQRRDNPATPKQRGTE